MAIKIVCDGDSLTVGAFETPYPTQLGRLLGPGFTITNLGVGGQTVAGMESDAAAQVDVLYDPSHEYNPLIVWGGINDFDDGETKETVYTRLETYCTNRKAAGFNPIMVCTLTPAPIGWIAESDRIWYNDQIRTNIATLGHAVIDLGADPRIGDPGDNLDTTYFDDVDHIHMVTAGYGVVAELAENVIANELGIEGELMSFTEFCCKTGGSNLNAGTRTGNSTEPGTSADFTYASGTWVQSTGVFTVASGNPQTDGVAVGDFASVYPDAATVTPFVGAVTARNSTTITVSLTAKAGSAPADGTTNTTLKIGGAWKGPNAAEAFPWGVIQSTLTNASGDQPRINMKNAAQFDITAALTHNSATGPITTQGYSTAYGDGGKAIIDGGTSGASYVLLTSNSGNNNYVDLIFQNNGATGSSTGVSVSGAECMFLRCVFHDLRGVGFLSAGNGHAIIECEAYACNQSNTAACGGFSSGGVGNVYRRCIAHDNAGSNTFGFGSNGASGAPVLLGCISESNGGDGFSEVNTATIFNFFYNCDFYNNGRDGIRIAATGAAVFHAENCNFVKNAGYGINFSGSAVTNHGLIQNCGFGAGTQVNTSGQVNRAGGVVISGSVTYAADVTPWNAPTTGDFRVTLAAAKGAGRGAFTQTQASYTGSSATPDLGAGQGTSVQSGGGGDGVPVSANTSGANGVVPVVVMEPGTPGCVPVIVVSGSF